MNRSIVVSILIFLTGCATTRPLFVAEPAPPPGESLIYIYRPSATAMQGMTAVIQLDERNVAELHNNSYTVVHVRQGNHQVSQYWSNMTFFEANNRPRNRTDLAVNTTAGRQYYFRLSVNGEVGPEGEIQISRVGWAFNEVSKAAAQAEIEKCRRVVPK